MVPFHSDHPHRWRPPQGAEDWLVMLDLLGKEMGLRAYTYLSHGRKLRATNELRYVGLY